MPLDFFKRKKRPDNNNGSLEKTKSFGKMEGGQKVKVHSRSSSAPIQAEDIKTFQEDYNDGNSCVAQCKINLNFDGDLNGGKKGNICWDLMATLHNANASKHFEDFLKASKRDNLLGFLLEVESFKACSISRMNASKSIKRGTNNCDITKNCTTTANENKQITMTTNNSKNHKKITLNQNIQELLRKHQKHKDTENDGKNLFRDSLRSNAMKNLDIKNLEIRKEKNKTKDIKQSLEKGVLKDAVEIFLKFLSKDSSRAISLPEQMYQTVIENICVEETSTFVTSYFDEVYEDVAKQLHETYFPRYLHSTEFSRHVLDTLTTNITLSDVLQLEAGFFAYTQFLDEEGHGSLLQFWMAAQTLRMQISKCNDAEQNQNDALVLYEKYFSLQATCPLNFRKDLRIQVESEICHEQGIKHLCFDNAIKHAYCVMEQVHLPHFRQSRFCMTLLRDVMHAIKQSQDRKRQRDALTVEDADNGECLSAINEQHNDCKDDDKTDAANISSSTENETTSSMMNFDLAIAEPNSLWKRPQTSGMTLGHINPLGQYVKGSQFSDEMNVVRSEKSTNRISKAVKRLVSNTPEKTEEEMAWQVANMIVNDINRQLLDNK